jgi:Cdc6-like AAA superfamily ATPase
MSAAATPLHLVGREKERQNIVDFLEGHVSKGTSGSLYVCGLPGTGKTATINEILGDYSDSLKVVLYPSAINLKTSLVLQINCMQVADPRSIYKVPLAGSHALERSEHDIF